MTSEAQSNTKHESGFEQDASHASTNISWYVQHKEPRPLPSNGNPFYMPRKVVYNVSTRPPVRPLPQPPNAMLKLVCKSESSPDVSPRCSACTQELHAACDKMKAKMVYRSESLVAQEEDGKQLPQMEEQPPRLCAREQAHSSLFSGMMTCHGPMTSTSPYAGGSTRTMRPVPQSTYHRLPRAIT